MVVTYDSKGNKTDEQIAQAKQQDLLARSYIRYIDANGLLRTYYNDYTGANLHRLAELLSFAGRYFKMVWMIFNCMIR
ncbi:hypothetical protein [Ruminococcus sp.]|uniref:hypothetical protein n=1 Tax=Ruminococcus sp. TaxID=41978 RepID=UPI0025FDB0EF|nr:hypothetical protein [Ruminococcus sp.]